LSLNSLYTPGIINDTQSGLFRELLQREASIARIQIKGLDVSGY
jgi:hypothetical protein